VSGAGQVAYFGPVELWVGRAAAFLGEPDEAVADLSAAVEICTVSGAAGYAVEARYELGSILAARGDPHARTLLDVAAQQARALGMTPFIPRIEKVKIAPDNPLTPREWEVARLVADGKTNREIAAALYLSDRTAQNHVQHILTKLGLANRSQIAAWMTKREMSTPSE
jgi:DNA-binding NarL/FixJ family response regulator